MTFVKTALFHKAGEGSGGGGGGGDQHNLGWYATESALTTAHATATDGDWAIVGATDTVWVWDSDSTGWKDTGAAGIELPDQTGHSGQFLITNGSAASWGTTVCKISIINDSNTTLASIGGTSRAIDVINNGGSNGVSLKFSNNANPASVYLDAMSWKFYPSTSKSFGSIGKPSNWWLESYVQNTHTEKINNGADITVPVVAGSMAVQVSTVPTADSTLEGQIYQFVGATDSTYTNGHFYKCVSDGQSPATYSWTAVEVQAGGGLQNTATGTNSLTILGTPATTSYATNIGVNSSAGYEGVAIGTNASCSNAYVAIGYGAQASAYGIGIGKSVKANGNTCIGIGYLAEPTGNSAVSIGAMNKVTGAYSIQLGGIGFTNSEPGTFCVGLGNGGNYFPNYKLMDSDGTIPTARLTKVNSTITLTAAGWSNGSQTVTVSGVTSSSIVWVSPDPTDQSAYVSAGILCTAQGTDSLTFTATTTPSADIDVVVVAM